jgi:hypothetical protein
VEGYQTSEILSAYQKAVLHSIKIIREKEKVL